MIPINPTVHNWTLQQSKPKEEEIEAAFNDCQLEQAKNLTFSRHGLWSLSTQKWLLHIIQKILKLNNAFILAIRN